MNGDPEGTPNPLNPMSGTADRASNSQSDEVEATGTGTLDSARPVSTSTNPADMLDKPTDQINSSDAPIGTPVDPTSVLSESSMPEIPKVAPTSAMPEMPVAKQPSRINHSVVDPMMRPVSRPNMTSVNSSMQSNPSDENRNPQDQNFNTLSMESITIEELQPQPTDDMNANFVAKDSVVEPAGVKKGGKKKALIIGAIVFLMVAIICGATAVAIVVLNNNNDRVTKAIDKLLNGGMSSIVQVKGAIQSESEIICDDDTYYPVDENADTGDASSNVQTVPQSTASCGEASRSTNVIDFDGTFDLKTSLNKVQANLRTTYNNGSEFSIALDELHNKSGDTFIKISLPESLMTPSNNSTESTTSGAADASKPESMETVTITETQTITDCQNGDGATDCVSTITTSSTATGIFSVFSGVFEVINDQWILATDDFVENMGDTALFNNNSTCIISAFGTLPEYSRDIANKYKANPFITYSTDKLEISKRKDNLYKLGYDSKKLAAFTNSLSNNGFINELNACANKTATNGQTGDDLIQQIMSNLPTMYVEIDDNNNFTRVYFKTTTTDGDYSTLINADLNLTYPTELKVTDPNEYINMSELVQKLSTEALASGDESASSNEDNDEKVVMNQDDDE